MKLNRWWLLRWLAFFKANADYAAYCDARASEDRATCSRLESQFERIAELFDDWGDIRGVPTSTTTTEGFIAWLAPRRHLFEDDTRVQWIEDPSTYVHSAGRMLLDIPLTDRKSETLLAVEKYLDLFYTYRKRVSTKASMRIVQQPLPKPKYVLHAPNGTVNKATSGSLRKAEYVSGYRKKLVGGRPMSITDTVLAIKRHAKNPLGWTMTPDDERAVARGTFAKSILGGSEVTLIKRHRKDFDAYVRNTIHGRFPDNT